MGDHVWVSKAPQYVTSHLTNSGGMENK